MLLGLVCPWRWSRPPDVNEDFRKLMIRIPRCGAGFLRLEHPPQGLVRLEGAARGHSSKLELALRKSDLGEVLQVRLRARAAAELRNRSGHGIRRRRWEIEVEHALQAIIPPVVCLDRSPGNGAFEQARAHLSITSAVCWVAFSFAPSLLGMTISYQGIAAPVRLTNDGTSLRSAILLR
jgi:hypothetical protein